MDWFLLLAPLLLLPIVSLLAFVGCDLDDHGTFEGIPVTIWVNTDAYPIDGYAGKLGFWCVYVDDDNTPKRFPDYDVEATWFEQPNESFTLHLPGSYAKHDIEFGCRCLCNVYLQKNDTLPHFEVESTLVPITVDSKVDFEFEVFPPTDTTGLGFAIGLKSFTY